MTDFAWSYWLQNRIDAALRASWHDVFQGSRSIHLQVGFSATLLASDDDLQNAVLICGWIEQTTARLRLAKRGEDLQLLAEKLILNLGHEMFTTLYARGASHASGDGWNRSSYR